MPPACRPWMVTEALKRTRGPALIIGKAPGGSPISLSGASDEPAGCPLKGSHFLKDTQGLLGRGAHDGPAGAVSCSACFP